MLSAYASVVNKIMKESQIDRHGNSDGGIPARPRQPLNIKHGTLPGLLKLTVLHHPIA